MADPLNPSLFDGCVMVISVCPVCTGFLVDNVKGWSCDGCGRQVRILRGILDLRTTDDDYLPDGADWAMAEQLDEAFDRLDFPGLLALYYDLNPEITASQRASQINHLLTAGTRAEGWIDALGSDLCSGPWLDLGCGSGSFLAKAAKDGREVVGLDVAMRWLIVARKRLDEAGLKQVQLVCGNAEQLPFLAQTFAAVVAGDAIEHVADQVQTLAEAHRVLKPVGKLFMATPNRLSVAPEPHVGLWGVGFLPRSWMPAYVRAMRRIDFRGIRTLSYVGWKRMLDQSPFRGASIRSPTLPMTDLAFMSRFKRGLALAHNRLVLNWLGQRLMRAVGPLFHIVATRSDDSPTSPPLHPSTKI